MFRMKMEIFCRSRVCQVHQNEGRVVTIQQLDVGVARHAGLGFLSDNHREVRAGLLREVLFSAVVSTSRRRKCVSLRTSERSIDIQNPASRGSGTA